MGTDRNLRILLYGEFAWDRLAASYKRAFEELGHQIIPFDEQTIREYLSPWLAHRVGHRATIGSLALRRAGSKRWNERLLKAFRETKPDLVLVLKGDFLMPETVRAIDERGTRVFILHPDNPFPPHNNNRPETLPTALECSVYLIWSRSLIGRLKSLGVKQVEYLPFAWDPHVFTARESWCEQKCDYDTVFIGGWDRERETWLSPMAKSFDLKIWGPDYWKTRTRLGSPLRRCWQGSAIWGREASHVLQRSKIAINIFRRQNLPDGVIMRTFELPGCGCFPLSTRSTGALEIFPEGEAAAYFSTPEELHDQTARYLVDEETRLRISKSAHSIVASKHTYLHRARQILSIFDEVSPAAPSR